MQQRESVSVIIPTWNRAHTIGAAVKSVLNQTYSVLEILVCDDGSSDSTREVLENLKDERIRIIDGPRAGRPAVPRNRGIKAAKGEWIAFLDSDDMWEPNKLEKQFDLLYKSKCNAACTNAWRVIPSKGKSGSYLQIEQQNISLPVLLKTNYVICSSVLVRKSILDDVGGFPEAERLKAIEDFALWLRVATKTEFAYLPEPLISYTDDAANSIRVDAKENVQRENVMNDFYAWFKTQSNQNDKDSVKQAVKLAMKNNGRSLFERLKVK